jgi:hypothetical protein
MVSEKCLARLKTGFTQETCISKAKKGIVMCRAVQLREGGMKYGDAVRKAWSEAKTTCAKFR